MKGGNYCFAAQYVLGVGKVVDIADWLSLKQLQSVHASLAVLVGFTIKAHCDRWGSSTRDDNTTLTVFFDIPILDDLVLPRK